MDGDTIRFTIAGVLLGTGALLSLSAAVGLLRFPDLLSRMHAATKPQILGLICVTAAIAVLNPTALVIGTAIVVITLQMLTAPIAAHMVGRAHYRSDDLRSDLLVVDELAESIAEADDEEHRDTANPS
ncbi:monovalent cation/H(+) antiporter subunit G [Pseudoclavibacter sp. 13-3]|uniref:monovalent cation/H(+) antiporter subunit G n=1 Tax=Pseudoclavibacter sp. 13-3 TaxID=2901228 RepID=UPI001E3B8109|nr:monovalent cation/H(+) antiporter subunit G [Pseudoclavibacter sp. 13-3]MCD7101973.1 monovalent cation/H(+) antiporter subunit G [Pseudoclavibacter sp. 13-3]